VVLKLVYVRQYENPSLFKDLYERSWVQIQPFRPLHLFGLKPKVCLMFKKWKWKYTFKIIFLIF
jgi:hypothetical protein